MAAMQDADPPLNFEQARISLEALDTDAVVLCASARLARNLRRDHDRIQLTHGLKSWQPLRAHTLSQWLAQVLQESLLAGELAASVSPRLVLDALQERIVWDSAITACGAADEQDDSDTLLDREGLIAAAAEANALMTAWNIRMPLAAAEQSRETREFLRWRHAFRRLCETAGWFDAARLLDWQIDQLGTGIGRLPIQLALAGFDRYNPQEVRLVRTLVRRGVTVLELEQGLPATAETRVLALPDRQGECAAAVAWAQARLAENPASRLGIVVPELGALRETLRGLLDVALDAPALRPALAEMPRRHNFSLGSPLARQPCVAVALQLLACAGAERMAYEDFSALLREPYWSADIAEADGRALLEARMRKILPPTFSFQRALRLVRRNAQRGLAVGRLLADLESFRVAWGAQPPRQVPSAWAVGFRAMLNAAGWPGERALSSHEYQAQRAFEMAVETLAGLDAVLGRIGAAEARRRLAQVCRERIFQPETVGDPPVQVMGLLEIADTPLDGIWVMGMNEHLWPPPARPNPLLPAALQRLARTPNASAEVQTEFARVIQRRLLRSAREVCFSWARSEATRPLRPSPLLAGLPDKEAVAAAIALPGHGPAAAAVEILQDDRAPPVGVGEMLRGGARLLQTQAICPAWAFYRYRLGARALETPVDGLDARARGNLVHAVLEHFWQARRLTDLRAMSAGQREVAVAAAVERALNEFDVAREEALAPRLRDLERERLIGLILEWLALEAQRSADFRVVAREENALVDIEGIAIHLRVDRIDELQDGRRVIIDYKTGGTLSAASWAADRIDEPQLPLYAAWLHGQSCPEVTAAEGVAAVVFAKVRRDECAFIGVAAESGLLPRVAGLAEARKLFPESQFPDWEGLQACWRSRIAAIAREIREGVAAVTFGDEKSLSHCDVKPLLRLPEVRAQRELLDLAPDARTPQ